MNIFPITTEPQAEVIHPLKRRHCVYPGRQWTRPEWDLCVLKSLTWPRRELLSALGKDNLFLGLARV